MHITLLPFLSLKYMSSLWELCMCCVLLQFFFYCRLELPVDCSSCHCLLYSQYSWCARPNQIVFLAGHSRIIQNLCQWSFADLNLQKSYILATDVFIQSSTVNWQVCLSTRPWWICFCILMLTLYKRLWPRSVKSVNVIQNQKYNVMQNFEHE